MKIRLLVYTLILFTNYLSTHSQTFSNSTFAAIHDTSTVCIPITISALPNQMNASFGISSFCLNITHTNDGDIVIKLISPNGTSAIVAGGVGAGGQNFTNTCFMMNGASGSIATGFPPFTGNYIPQNSLNVFNNGQNPNGIWQLCVSDTYFNDTGAVHSFNITFANNPPPDPAIPPVICTYCTCENDAPDTCSLLPDMTASALCIQQDHSESPGSLSLGNSTPNIGRGPMEIHGLDSCFCGTQHVPCTTVTCPNPTDTLKHIIIQRIYRKVGTDTLKSYDRIAGKMTYHRAHGHLHVDHWADYSLRVATPDPDATKWPIVGTSVKQSFCLINLGDCTNNLGYCKDTLGNTLTVADIPNAGFGLYSGCGLDQGIYPGNLDIYSSGLNNPIPISVCNGNYYIVSITDPGKHFLESNKKNNWVSVPITLTMQTNPYGASSFNYSMNGTQLSATNTSPTGVKYLWTYGDGTWDTTFNAAHTYAGPGPYTVTLVSLNQCYTPHTQVISTTAINEYQHIDLNLRVYPNPISENTVVMYYLPDQGHVTLELTDLTGRTIRTYVNEKQKQGVQKVLISEDPEGLASGSYLLHLLTEFGRNTAKIVKTR